MKDLSLHLMDIMQNSISAAASKITVSVHTDGNKDTLTLEVSDNGRGMDEELLKNVTNPFVTTRTTRKVGLGIPLLKDSVQRADGDLKISSVKDIGTTLTADFKINHIDRLPIGDIARTLTNVIMAHPELELELILQGPVESFRLDTCEVRGKLGAVPIEQYEVIAWMNEYIHQGIKITFGGVLNEIDC